MTPVGDPQPVGAAAEVDLVLALAGDDELGVDPRVERRVGRRSGRSRTPSRRPAGPAVADHRDRGPTAAARPGLGGPRSPGGPRAIEPAGTPRSRDQVVGQLAAGRDQPAAPAPAQPEPAVAAGGTRRSSGRRGAASARRSPGRPSAIAAPEDVEQVGAARAARRTGARGRPGRAASGGPGPGTRRPGGRVAASPAGRDAEHLRPRPEPLQPIEQGPDRPALVAGRPAGRPGAGPFARARPSARLLARIAVARGSSSGDLDLVGPRRTVSRSRPDPGQARSARHRDRVRPIAAAVGGRGARWNRRGRSLILDRLASRARIAAVRSAFRRTSHEFTSDGRDVRLGRPGRADVAAEPAAGQRRLGGPGQARGHQARRGRPAGRGARPDRGRARAWARPCWPGRWPRASTARSGGSSSRPTCSPRTSSARASTTRPRGEFVFKPGPIFANVILADEINRTTPRTQSALLEAMSDGQVSVEGKTYVARARRSSCWRRRTPTSSRGPTSCPRASSTGS